MKESLPGLNLRSPTAVSTATRSFELSSPGLTPELCLTSPWSGPGTTPELWGERAIHSDRVVYSAGSSSAGAAKPLLLASLICVCASGCLDDDLAPYDGFVLDDEASESRSEQTSSDDALDAGADSSRSDGDGGPASATADPLDDFSEGDERELNDVAVFIALEHDFASFTSWPRASLGNGPHVIAEEPGPKRVYINALPVAADDEFRVGTMIVKTVEVTESPSSWQAHAMAKRGGGFNAKGAYEWEYFDLQLDAQGAVTMAWRGEQPPDGESYRTAIIGSDGEEVVVEQDCNDCHVSSNNDAVLTPQLQLDAL